MTFSRHPARPFDNVEAFQQSSRYARPPGRLTGAGTFQNLKLYLLDSVSRASCVRATRLSFNIKVPT